jgi:single-strand DNA-binding protein
MNNLIALIGHVGQAPHTVSFEDTGKKVVKFSLAVKEFSSNTDEEKTLWIDVDAWGGLGDRVFSTITKGREVAVQGRLSLSTFTKEVDGVQVKVTKPVVNLTSFHLCGRKPVAEGTQPVETEAKQKMRRGFRLAATNG